ncbi:hypothetical protein ACIBK8_28195 [Streptomyces sp. NPDC050161]|uniref:hypothetical protein n=1 Tax=Streptomyces sp. NPDC050161 TaxID=3365604 RepID=UPI00379D0765
MGHPLNLAKQEFATLLRLLEAVMAPGWTRRDGRVTPAGLLGTRTDRGAATDRLALLLLVLEARESGRVRQCGGAVGTKRGRAAAVARLLGCTASAGGHRAAAAPGGESHGVREGARVGSVPGRKPAAARAHVDAAAAQPEDDVPAAPMARYRRPLGRLRSGGSPGVSLRRRLVEPGSVRVSQRRGPLPAGVEPGS